MQAVFSNIQQSIVITRPYIYLIYITHFIPINIIRLCDCMPRLIYKYTNILVITTIIFTFIY